MARMCVQKLRQRKDKERTKKFYIANHLTTAIDGTLYDKWNCGSKSVGNYWIK